MNNIEHWAEPRGVIQASGDQSNVTTLRDVRQESPVSEQRQLTSDQSGCACVTIVNENYDQETKKQRQC